MFELMHKCDLNVSTVELKYKTMGFKKKNLLLITQMRHRLILLKSRSSNFRVSHSISIICIPSATHRVVFTPIHHCICFAWQNEKYWELFREVCQKNLRGSWVLHIFPVTLMKRNLFENLPRSAAVGHWMCVQAGLPGPFTDFCAQVCRTLNCSGRAVQKAAQICLWTDWISHEKNS